VKFLNQLTERTPRAQARQTIKRMIATGFKVGDKLPTYRDLAAQLDVSLLTIQRAVHDLTREGIIYSLHAKGAFVKRLPPAEGKLAQVGLLYPASMTNLVQTPYLTEILGGIMWHCDQNNIDLQVFSIRRTMREIPAREIALRVDGVLLVGVLNEHYIATFADQPIPVALVDAQAQDAPFHCLCVDNALCVDLVMDHLHQLGHRRIAYLDMSVPDFVAAPGTGQPVDSTDNRERRLAYLAAMQRLDQGAYQHVYQVAAIDQMPEVVDQLFSETPRSTAVVAYDTNVAHSFYQHLRERNIQVPRDLSLAAAVGAKNTGTIGNQSLTFSLADFQAMGSVAIRSLMQQAGGTQPRQHHIQRISGSLAISSSTGEPPR
jgi:DNA-binding LacI/PurR family transcriptional regulator